MRERWRRLGRGQLLAAGLAAAAATLGLVGWGAEAAWQGVSGNPAAVLSESVVPVRISSVHCSGTSPPYATCADTSGDVVLSWTAVAGSPGIVVYRATSPAGPYAEVASLAGTATGYTDPSAVSNAQYYYQVVSEAHPGWLPGSHVDMALSLPPSGGTDASSAHGTVSFSAANLSAMAVADGVTYTTASSWGGGGALPMETDQVNGVHCISTSQCWAVGGSGAIWTTGDGGYTWTEQSVPGNRTLQAVDFVSATASWAVGQSGSVYVTTDGGASWSKQTVGPNATLYGLDMVDTADGVAVGAGGTIITTTTGGSTWVRQTSGTGEQLNAVACAGASLCWAVGDAGTVLVSRNGGTAWTAPSWWTGRGTAPNLNGISCPSATQCWAVGAAGTIIATSDGGATWTRQTSGTTQDLLGISMVDGATGWAVGAGGTILHTTNGGSTWRLETSNTTQAINAVSAVTRAFVMVGLTPGGGTPSALVTSDAGADWYPPSSQYLEWSFSPVLASGAPVTSAFLSLVDAATADATSPTQTYVLVSLDAATWASFLIADPTTTMTTQVVDIGSVLSGSGNISGLRIRYLCTEATGFRSIVDLVHVDIN